MIGQEPFGLSQFADNPEPRCPVVLLLDISTSMDERSGGEETRLQALNAGLKVFEQDMQQDPLARKRCEVAVVTFGEHIEVQPFVTADAFHAPVLKASGLTPMGAGILKALDLLAERKELYRHEGIAYYKPWIFMITDGAATDDTQGAAERVAALEAAKGVAFYSVMAGDAPMTELARINPKREPLRLKNVNYRELFLWLSNSMSSVSRSTIGGDVPLTSPAGWSTP